jgi:cation diffusion facilitator family transporter
LLLLGGSRAKSAPTPEHPFGYGRERYFWSFVVALVLFSLGSLFALYEGEEKLRHPHALESVEWAIGILVVAIVLETYSFATAIRESRHAKGSASWWKFIRHSKSPELPVVLLEDLGALLGLIFALCGVTAAWVTGEPRWDALGTLAIGVLLGVIAIILIVEMKSLLIGESASAAQQAAIRRAIESHPNVRTLIHMRTQHLGPDELLLGAKIELDRALDSVAVAGEIDEIEHAVRTAVPSARVIYLEPAVFEPARTPASTRSGDRR